QAFEVCLRGSYGVPGRGSQHAQARWMVGLPRTTERPVHEYGNECSELPARVVPQSHGRESVVRGLLQDQLSTAERLLDLVNGLLDLAKIEAGRMELRMEPVRIDELIQGTLSSVEPILKPGRVRLLREITPGIPTLNTDRDKLRQIILNLVGNAAKFTEEGEIKVSALRQDGSLRLVVSDTGIGIGKGELNHIFEEFRQGEISNGRVYGGTGLGLAIAKKLVDLLDGDISVDSEVGKGSTFTVSLPLGHRTSGPSLTREEYPA
ncbi:MAG: sensor histidine kinase, partial [Candidatus Bipolaricaulia bacterium]